jgi:hypothetical protein
MEMTASSPLPEIARVLLRFNHVASVIENANHSAHSIAVFAAPKRIGLKSN